MAQRGLGKYGKDRIKESLNATSKDVGGSRSSREEAFDPWIATSPGFNNAVPAMLGVNTNGTDSTRLSHAQYFFDPETMSGNFYVKFRRRGDEYVYSGVPLYAARRIYDALSKGKSTPELEQFGYYKHQGGESEYFARQPGTPLGRKFMSGIVTPQDNQQKTLFEAEGKEVNPVQRNLYQDQLGLNWGEID